MASWHPTTPLEEEIVALQPDHNFIYGELTNQEKRRTAYQPRPRDHLEQLNYKNSRNSQTAVSHGFEMPGGCSLGLIRTVHEIVGTKQRGVNANINDWDTHENVEEETKAMIRHFGMGPSHDFPLNKKLTRPTLPVEGTSPYIRRNGENLFPILLDSDAFKVVSTRMRNAELAKLIAGKSSDSDDILKTEDIKSIRAVPCVEETFETTEDLQKRELTAFQEEYPTLGQQKSKSPKKNKNNTQPKREIENWRSRSSSFASDLYSTPNGQSNNWRARPSLSPSDLNFSNICNISTGSNSSYYSFNTSSSEDYASAKEFLDNSNSQKKPQQKPSYAHVIQNTPSAKENLSNANNFPKVNERLFTPKDVYYRKHRNN